MLIDFGNSIVNTENAFAIQKDGIYINFLMQNGENIGFCIGEENVNNLYEKIRKSCGAIPAKKRTRKKKAGQ